MLTREVSLPIDAIRVLCSHEKEHDSPKQGMPDGYALRTFASSSYKADLWPNAKTLTIQRELERRNYMTWVNDKVMWEPDFDNLLPTLKAMLGWLERVRLHATAHTRILYGTSIEYFGKMYPAGVLKHGQERGLPDPVDAGIMVEEMSHEPMGSMSRIFCGSQLRRAVVEEGFTILKNVGQVKCLLWSKFKFTRTVEIPPTFFTRRRASRWFSKRLHGIWRPKEWKCIDTITRSKLRASRRTSRTCSSMLLNRSIWR